MRFHHLDLNLLVALDSLLTEANVSRAARQCALSQSAMSGVLARLRAHFEDDLLVQVGRKMVLTTLARSLATPVRDLLLQAQSVAVTRATFDPASSARQFVLMASDYVATVILADLNRVLAKMAPGISVMLRPLGDPRTRGDFDDGKVDFVILPDEFLSPFHPRERLFDDSWTCIAWDKNAVVGKRVSLKQYLALSHVVTILRDGDTPVFDQQFLHSLGHERKIACVVPNFTLMADFIVGTQFVATVHSRMARILARRFPLKLFPPPLRIPPIAMMMQWHKALDRDPSSTWMRSVLSEVAQKM